MDIFFFSKEHEVAYRKLLSRMQSDDCYHQALAYLLTLDTVLCEHIESIFDVQKDVIKFEGLDECFQTSTSRKTTRLAFNLWNGCYTDGETYKCKGGYETDLPSRYYAVDEIFNCSYAPYYWQAVQLRYPFYRR